MQKLSEELPRLQISTLAIVGSRTLGNQGIYWGTYRDHAIASKLAELDYSEMVEHIHSHVDVACLTRIVSGGANGVDSMAERFAKQNRLDMEVYPADWDKYGRSAGYIRNQTIIEQCEAVIVFWDGVSKGSQHAMILAPKLSRELRVVRMDPKNHKW